MQSEHPLVIEQEPGKPPFRPAAVPLASQRVTADEVLLEVDERVESQLERRHLMRVVHVDRRTGAVGSRTRVVGADDQEPGFHARDVDRVLADQLDPERPAHRSDGVPDLLPR